MKYRSGFVSNSSSASFCIIGINDDEEMIKKILLAENLIDEDYKAEEGYYDDYCLSDAKTVELYGYEGDDYPCYAGIDAEKLLKTMTIPEACEHVSKEIKEKLGIDIPVNKISFHYGEADWY